MCVYEPWKFCALLLSSVANRQEASLFLTDIPDNNNNYYNNTALAAELSSIPCLVPDLFPLVDYIPYSRPRILP